MKINKEKLVQIINEEVDLMKKHQHRGQYMDHPDKEGKMAMNQLEDIAKYLFLLSSSFSIEFNIVSLLKFIFKTSSKSTTQT